MGDGGGSDRGSPTNEDSMTHHEYSFGEIYREMREQVLGLGFRMTGRKEDAEDVLQETFLLVHRHLAKFKGEVHRTADNRWSNHGNNGWWTRKDAHGTRDVVVIQKPQ